MLNARNTYPRHDISGINIKNDKVINCKSSQHFYLTLPRCSVPKRLHSRLKVSANRSAAYLRPNGSELVKATSSFILNITSPKENPTVAEKLY